MEGGTLWRAGVMERPSAVARGEDSNTPAARAFSFKEMPWQSRGVVGSAFRCPLRASVFEPPE